MNERSNAPAPDPPLKALVFTTVFPNPRQPVHGVFVRERTRHLLPYADIRVVAPISWYQGRDAVPAVECQGSLRVYHPTFFYVPAIFKALDGLFLFLSSLPGIAGLKREFRFDLIDAHFGFPEGFAAVLLGRWFHCPVVVTLRGSERAFVASTLRRAAIGWTVRRADRVVAVSDQLGALAQQLGTPADRVEVIPNGVDTNRFTPEPRDRARAAFGLTITGPLILMVGHLVPLKGFHRVITAFSILATEFPGSALAIVGGPAAGNVRYPEQLAEQVKELHLEGRVLLVGSQTPDQVATWLNASDLFVLDSDREGSPNVVCEALACGVPVVASRVGEVENMVPPDSGIVFDDPTDIKEIARCISAALRTKWDRAAIRQGAERNTWDRVALRVLDAWRSAQQQAQGPGL
jgi:glycosyltransferase involved in cell wall biosynthesis